MASRPDPPFAGRTAWTRTLRTPLRAFLQTESGGAAVLLGAAVAALVWVNVHAASYDDFWATTLAIEIGGSGVSLSLHEWVNSGLMAFFFFVLGLEARRELDLGELRERRRFALPLLAAVGGMAVAVSIYLAFNAGRGSASGWGIAMSTGHGVRARPAGARGAAVPRPAARIHAHDRRRRRPARARRHRHRLHG
jgi:Na+/H+ antiporter NhaA